MGGEHVHRGSKSGQGGVPGLIPEGGDTVGWVQGRNKEGRDSVWGKSEGGTKGGTRSEGGPVAIGGGV